MNTITKSAFTEICTFVGHLARKVVRKDRVIEKLKDEVRWWRNAHGISEEQCERIAYIRDRIAETRDRYKERLDSATQHWKQCEEEMAVMRRELGLHRNLRQLHHELGRHVSASRKRRLEELQEKHGVKEKDYRRRS